MPKTFTLGLDVGGTKIRAAAVSPTGKTSYFVELPTDTESGKAAVLAKIMLAADLVTTTMKGRPSAIGVGMAGIVDHKAGIYSFGPNFPKNFVNIPIAALLRKIYRVPVEVDNDVHCFTLAEAKYGAAKRYSTVVGLTLGTGIGGGIVIDGRIFRGRNNAAGEFGHMMLQMGSSTVCSCGEKGHFEALAAGSAFRRLYLARTGTTIPSAEVERLAGEGNETASTILSEITNSITEGIASIIHVFNPDIVVIGGGLSRSSGIIKSVQTMLKSRIVFSAMRDTPVVRATLGLDAGVIGAALITK